MEASVKGDSECMSHALCHHFCPHELPSRHCVSDLPFEAGEESLSLMSASNAFFRGWGGGSAGKNRVSQKKTPHKKKQQIVILAIPVLIFVRRWAVNIEVA